MHPQFALAMTLKRDMIVIDCDHRLPTDAALQRSRQHLAGFLCHRLARSRSELPGPQGIVKVLFASIRFRIERTQSSFDRLRARQMMVADHLPERSRSAMHHQPEPVLFVRLHLKEVVSTAESRKLDLALPLANCL